MIILEGPDGGGKTTLARYLSEKFDLQLGQRGTTNRDELYKVTRSDTYTHLAHAVQANMPPKILDRLFISEFVYADIVGRPCEFSSYEREFVLGVLNALGCPVILCLPPWGVVESSEQGTHQMEGVHQNLKTIYGRYKNWRSLPFPRNTMLYDYTGLTPGAANLEDVEEEVVGYLIQRKEREAWVSTGIH